MLFGILAIELADDLLEVKLLAKLDMIGDSSLTAFLLLNN